MSQSSTFVKRLLTEERLAYFCTTDMRNVPHLVPVFFLFDLDVCHACFLFSRGTKKVRNLRLHPEISFTVDVRDHINPLENKGVMIQGRAKVRESNSPEVDMEHVKVLFEEKYGWSPSESFFQYNHDECLVDVTVTKVSCWQGASFLACPKFCISSSRWSCSRIGESYR